MTADELRARLDRYTDFLRSDPHNEGLICEVADLHLKLGELQKAREVLSRGLEHADSAGLKFRLASVAIASGKPEEAIGLLQQLREAGITTDVISYNLGYALTLASRFEEANEVLSTITDFTSAPDAPLLLAKTLHQLGKMPEAVEQLKNHLARHPDDSAALGLLALVYLDSGDNIQAKSAAERALAINPEELNALVTMGSLALSVQDEEAARSAYTAAVARHPKSGRAWSGIGLATLLSLDFAKAAEEFQKAVQYMPNHIGTWHSLAWCQIMLNDLKQARASFEKAMDIDRNFGETHGGLAVIAGFEGREEDARNLIKRALRLNPSSFSARYAQGLLESHGDREKIQSVIDQIVGSAATPSGEPLQEVVRRFMLKKAEPRGTLH